MERERQELNGGEAKERQSEQPFVCNDANKEFDFACLQNLNTCVNSMNYRTRGRLN